MNITAVNRFEAIKDILVYITFANNEVTAGELEENVLDASRNTINCHLRQLVATGYLQSNGKQNDRAYQATEKTKQLFGVKA